MAAETHILGPGDDIVTSSDRLGPENRSQGRYDLAQPIKIRYRLFQEFIQEMSTNISTGGMFIATTEPLVIGEQFEFEFALEDGFTLVKGRAEVVWIRKESAGPSHPAGMGVRFVELDEASRSLINKMVEKLRMKGKAPFDVESRGMPPPKTRRLKLAARSRPSDADGQGIAGSLASAEAADAAAVGPRRRAPRFFRLLLGSIIAGLGIVFAFNTFFVQPRMEELERRIESLSRPFPVEPADPERGPLDEVEGEAGEAVVVEETLPDLTQPLDVVEEWALAWSEQRIDDYLATYSASFEPGGELTRREWENLRRSRILGGSRIEVQVLLAEEVELGPEERIVSFVQSYRSNTYQDRVRKVLRLVWQDESWKIVEERVVRALPD